MMAPYTIAHLKLDMLINWWGDQKLPATHKDRVQIYLTNSLDQTELTNKYTLAEMIAKEANEANNIKHNAPVMVMLGNPPYSVSSSNKSKWITDLLEIYKKDLNERNIQPLSDDYIKFIRLGQYYIERTGEGILAYISNNSFLDGLIHRQMRRELMRCFDDIYILDLHGNNRKKETAPNGSKDENVFSIMQGVSINIFVKKPHGEDKPATIHHYDLYGSRKSKYAFLLDNSLSSVSWQDLLPQEPNLFFVPKDFGAQEEYERGFKVDELFIKNSSGIKSHHDNDLVSFEPFDTDYNQKYFYRPFDNRYINYDLKKVVRHRYDIMRHLLKNNLSLITCKQQTANPFRHTFISTYISDTNSISVSGGEISYVFPLYMYDEGSIDTERLANIDETIANKIAEILHWSYVPDSRIVVDLAEGYENVLYPEDIFDYIYGVLHSPAYRAKYKEFLKVDFPRIPYPKNADEFEHFRSYGNQLRELHLMHNVPESSVSFPFPGNMQVDYLRWEWNKDDGYSGNIWINDTQCFEGIPTEAWNFYIGGYQPAQKWLKDRKGRTLSFDDIEHYRRIISVLIETKTIMEKIG